jgi:hypothetical protein
MLLGHSFLIIPMLAIFFAGRSSIIVPRSKLRILLTLIQSEWRVPDVCEL